HAHCRVAQVRSQRQRVRGAHAAQAAAPVVQVRCGRQEAFTRQVYSVSHSGGMSDASASREMARQAGNGPKKWTALAPEIVARTRGVESRQQVSETAPTDRAEGARCWRSGGGANAGETRRPRSRP